MDEKGEVPADRGESRSQKFKLGLALAGVNVGARRNGHCGQRGVVEKAWNLEAHESQEMEKR